MSLLHFALSLLISTSASSPLHVGESGVMSADDKASTALYRKNQRDLERWLENSKAPRDWALASQLLQALGDNSALARRKSGALLRKAADATPNDRLIQWLWSLQPIDSSGCSTTTECKTRMSALVSLEPGNAAALTSVVTTAWEQKDFPALDALLARMADASRYDDSFGVLFRAWEDVIRRWPRAAPSTPMTEDISIDVFGRSMKLLQWTEPKSMDAIDQSPAGAALVLVDEGPWPNHFQLVRICDRESNPAADPRRFEYCETIGRMMLKHSSFLLERFEGALVLRVCGTANADDIAAARAMRWQQWKFTGLDMEHNVTALDDYLAAYDASNSEIEAMRHALKRANVPLVPPTSWQPMRDGKVINPLGEPHLQGTASTKE